ncbi:prepilin-type N-terminal cleavage/methylation domain-containing protein [Pantoea sp. SORGH_AS_0659]|uniref:prepilin-type N-terminal cleavage/methylation domain-containing protein n=1 Tax=Pantoea sp. SORGH_AS_0659 TaxID=3062597 RepID=UPI002858A024|nr:prepilin-type N-terminal cleavage/methylation domain-containing protein [Pantoea sp. SORGH_AS_0659]MDR6352487.1 prepilin-type N-terminal cleavage/methylation domain-containing protein [Pantoea sp. SORGH_AS_0659]
MNLVNRDAGFTLTELMIALFVLGLSATFVLPLVSSSSPEKPEALLLMDIQLASQRAQTEKRPWLIAFSEKGWKMMALQPQVDGQPSPWPGSTWRGVPSRPSRVLPAGMSIVLTTPEGMPAATNGILLLPDNSNSLPVITLLQNNQPVKRLAFQDGEYQEMS